MEKYILICDDENNGFSARSLRSELQQTSIKCVSLSDFPGIAAYPDQIIKIMEGAFCIIIAMTSHSGSSSLIINIVNKARELHKPIIVYNNDDTFHGSGELQFALSASRKVSSTEDIVRMLEPEFAKEQYDDICSKSASISKNGAAEKKSMTGTRPEPYNAGKSPCEPSDIIIEEAKRQDPQPEIKEKKKHGIFGLFGKKDKKVDQPAPAPSEKANFSVISPKAVSPDSYGLIDLYMYTDQQRAIVDEAIRKAEGPVKETSKTGFEVARNTSVTTRLESNDVEIRDNMDTQTWNGSSLHFDFSFFVPAEFSRSQAAFTCYIEYNGIPVTRLNFLVSITEAAGKDAIPAKVTQSDYHKAFISYSRKDEQRMLARVLGIQQLAPDLSFWLDKQSMDAGAIWRDEIRDAILISDVLLLFWSVAASQSGEVEKEWSFAFENRGLEFIAPVPLDPPDKCPPPDKLSPLNFSVREFSQNDITRKLSFYDSRNIKLV